MGTHRQPVTNRRVTSYVTTGVALQLASLCGFVYAVDHNAPMTRLLAATSIFIDGTKDIIPTGNSQDPDRMKGTLTGTLNQGHDYVSAPGVGGNVYVDYPRSFGVLTGLADPTYDASKVLATQNTITAIKDARNQNPGDPIYVVGYSQGANAASDAIAQLEAEGYDTSDITFVLVGNGARNDGGLWARLPAAVYVPLIGLSFGASNNPVAGGPDIIQISKQYDGASDVPKYVLNPVAWANTVLGFVYVHNGYYQDVDFDLNNDTKIDAEDVAMAQADPDHYIVTKNGNITDVVIRNPVGQLPLTRPLLDMGVPQELVDALDPLLRAVIETAYVRVPNGGTYAAEPVHLQLMPGLSQWGTDAGAIAEGLQETMQRLAALNLTNPVTTLNVSQSIAPPTGTNVARFNAPPAVDPPKGDILQESGSQDSTTLTDKTDPVAPVDTPDPVAATGTVEHSTPSSVPNTPPTPVKEVQRNIVRGPIGGSPNMPGLKAVRTAVNGFVTKTDTAIRGALGLPPRNSTSPAPGPSGSGTESGATDPGTGTSGTAPGAGTDGAGSGSETGSSASAAG